jgi:hypothetical protein
VSSYRRFTRLGQFDADQIIQHLELYPALQQWWDYDLTPGFIGAGAQAERPVGRLVFYHHLPLIHQTLLDDFKAPLANDLQQQLLARGLEQVSKQPLVFLIGSLAGGTCAGMLIDMAWVVRWLLRRVGYEGGGINITAILGLESVINVETKDPVSEAARKRRCNVNGALREIDFLQGRPQGFSISYPQPLGNIEPIPPLFNQVYMFTARRMGGFFLPNQRDILSRVAHFIFGQVASETGREARAIMDNRRQYFNPDARRMKDGLKAIYGAFGVEWLEVPKHHLLAAWCRQHARLLGEKVVELEWQREPRENLLRKFKELLAPELQGYRKALDLVALGPEGILTAPGLAQLTVTLDAIQQARKKKELEAALQNFEVELPRLLEPLLRREVSLAADAAREDAWLLEIIQTLFRDRGFRVGGARRVLTEAAAQLQSLTAQAERAPAPVNDVVKQACNVLGRVKNHGVALAWAREKIFHTVRHLIRNLLGVRADALAGKMKECANGIQRLQEAVRDLLQKLEQLQPPPDLIPQDTWLLNPADIQGVLADNPDEVARRGADEIAVSLAAEITLGQLRTHDLGFLDQLSYWVETAIEKAIQTRIRRPADNVQRIKQRMAQCEPLARITTDGPEFHQIMQDHQRSTPLKIVLTGLGGAEREELQQWANEENQRLGGQKVYEVSTKPEELRDDVLYLTFGWPLWLFDEIRDGEQELEKAKGYDLRNYQNSFLLFRQIPASRDHEIKPLPEEDARRWFGIALALRDIEFSGSQIIFNSAHFPGVQPLENLNLAERVAKAYELFRQAGFSFTYRDYVKQEISRDPAAFKKRLEEGLAARQEALRQAREGGQLPQEVADTLADFYQKAQEYARGIVIL